MRNKRFVGWWSVLLVVACSEPQAPNDLKPIEPQMSVAAASAPIGGVPGFRFDSPIAPTPGSDGTASFDGTLADLLSVQICEWSGAGCVGTPIRTITHTDPSPATLRVVTGTKLYQAIWNTALDPLDPSKDYRLRVMSGPTELGYAELDVVSPSETGPTSAPGRVRVVRNSTLPVRFRIEQGVGVRVGPAGSKVTLAGGNVTLDVPAGAVPGDVLFTAVPATNLPSGGPATVPGSEWEFGPNGIVFAKPVTLTIKYDPARIPPGVTEAELRIHKLVNGSYVQQNAGSIDMAAHTVSAQVGGFSVFVLLQRLFPGSQPDVQGPTMVSVEFYDPATNTYAPSLNINTSGSDVTVQSRVTITDDISGADYIDVRLRSPSGRQMRFTCYPYPFRAPTTGSDTNGQWDCTSTWAQFSETGTWTVQWIPLRDKVGNWRYYSPSASGVCEYVGGQQTGCLAAAPQVTVTSTPTDVTPAHVSAFEVSLNTQPRAYASSVSVDASTAFRPLVFRVHVTDALSGAGAPANDFYYLMLTGPGNQQLGAGCSLAQGTPADGDWECVLSIPQGAQAGTWRVTYAIFTDRVGNNGYYTGGGFTNRGSSTQLCDADGQCITPPTVIVTSTGDGQAPLLQSVSIAATNNDVATTLGITDDIMGVSSVTIRYISQVAPSQYQDCYAPRTAGTATNGSFSCTITFSQFAARGLWSIAVYVWDAAGNFRYYYRRQSDGYLCYNPTGGGAAVCQDFGTTDLRLQ